MTTYLPRPALLDRVLTDETGTVLLSAPAGAGKSVLLDRISDVTGTRICTAAHPGADDIRNGWLLWDVPASAGDPDLPSWLVDEIEHLIIACRPGQNISGIARRILHHGVTRIAASEFSFTRAMLAPLPHPLPDDILSRFLEDYAGWPAFLPLARSPDPDPDPDPDLARDYLSEAILRQLTPTETARLHLWLETPSPAPSGSWTEALPSQVLRDPTAHPLLLSLLHSAVAARMRILSETNDIHQLAQVLEAAQKPLEAIALLIDHGEQDHAAQILERAQGLELIYASNLTTFRSVVLRFSQEILSKNETVLFAVTRTLMKMGELNRVRHLVSKHLGSDYLDPLKVLSRGSRFSFAARRFRLNMMISEDLTPNDAMLVRLGEFMADYPVGDNQKWAAFYNALLEFEIRRRNFREAEAAAARALLYFRQMGGHPLLEFFIHLHQAVLRLTGGDVLHARQAARDARSRLEMVPHDAANEFRMLRLVEASIAYEAGHPQPLVDFVQRDFDSFAAAEIWPSLFHFAFHYASQALMDHFPASLRPGFLDGLWIHLAERLDLHATAELRTAIGYQNAGRRSEALTVLLALRSARGRTWHESAVDELQRLSRREEIQTAMVWLRDAALSQMPRPHLERQIERLLANPKITQRERVALQLWLAHIALSRRDLSGSRGHLQTALQITSRLGCTGVLSEERIFLAVLLKDNRLRSHVEASADVRSVLTLYATAIHSPQAKARAGGLTQRETQMLQLLSEGAPNKRIAQMLGISEVTVKFHLSNLYAKIGVSRRAEALKAAKALGWL